MEVMVDWGDSFAEVVTGKYNDNFSRCHRDYKHDHRHGRQSQRHSRFLQKEPKILPCVQKRKNSQVHM